MIVFETSKTKEKRHLGEVFYLTFVYSFAAIGALFVSVFFANRFKVTNVSGSVDVLSNNFQKNYSDNSRVLSLNTAVDTEGSPSASLTISSVDKQISELTNKKQQLISYLCGIKSIVSYAPKNVLKIIEVKNQTGSASIANNMIFTVKTHLTENEKIEQETNECISSYQPTTISEEVIKNTATGLAGKDIFVWPDNSEWGVLSDAIIKDREVIGQAAKVTKMDSRTIVSSLVVEQLRLFYSQRELYKKFFEPLKILANANKFSLGVMSIKEETAIATEKHLKDPSSPFYLGEEFESILDFPQNVDIPSERYNRLTATNHYYNYLYGAIYLKQMISQWQKEGFDISQRPEIIGTLFNLGFSKSKPNSNPEVGGSSIYIGNTNYSFGRLAGEFYYSGEMAEFFPYTQGL